MKVFESVKGVFQFFLIVSAASIVVFGASRPEFLLPGMFYRYLYGRLSFLGLGYAPRIFWFIPFSIVGIVLSGVLARLEALSKGYVSENFGGLSSDGRDYLRRHGVLGSED